MLEKRSTWVVFIIGLVVTLVTTLAYADLYWTTEVSEEAGGPPTICLAVNEGAVGFGCRGRYCDNVQQFCETLPFGITMELSSYQWSDFFSEENDPFAVGFSIGWYPYDDDNYHVCHNLAESGMMTGIRCSGRYCDRISVECAQPVKDVNGTRVSALLTNCAWLGPYSEEQGQVDFGWNRYITGVKCDGRYCDRKHFHVCSLVDPAP